MKNLKANDIIIFNDDILRTPYLVHEVVYENNKPISVSLGLQEYPEIEQDYYTPIEDVIKLSGAELKEARKQINLQLF